MVIGAKIIRERVVPEMTQYEGRQYIQSFGINDINNSGVWGKYVILKYIILK
jgi:hypothetical protein